VSAAIRSTIRSGARAQRRMMPAKVLITGGSRGGGLESFAESLCAGFAELGIPAEVVPPRRILLHWQELRDPQVLKILSTGAVFAAPLARRTLCVAHGFPRADVQGWAKLGAILVSYKIANRFSRLVTVSHYAAVHLRAVFNLRIDAVIHNPLHEAFLRDEPSAEPRDLITFVGRLHPAKGLDRIFPAICELLEENPGLRACIIGDGELRGELEARAAGHARIEFTGALSRDEVRVRLRRTRVFVSACETEALGIVYLEALSQGCAVAMPACGGGIEIAPDEIGSSIHLLALPLESGAILMKLRKALECDRASDLPEGFDGASVAQHYLDADAKWLPARTSSICGAPAREGRQ
jgi:glycosyltransferase involved in cell wall biosynthesis